MTRLQALEGLHTVVRAYDEGTKADTRWADVRAALDTLSALPREAEDEGQTVEVAVWEEHGGRIRFERAGSEGDGGFSPIWTRHGTTRLAVKKGEGA